jgi:hypothetical protein
LRRIVVEISAGGFDHLVTTVQFFSDREGFARVVFGVEPTSVYHKPLAGSSIVISKHQRAHTACRF